MQGIVDDALKKVEAAGHTIKTVLVFDHKNAARKEEVAFTEGRDVWWQEAVSQHPTHCDIEWMGAEDPLFKVRILRISAFGHACLIRLMAPAPSASWVRPSATLMSF